jgi:uncharacterized pyridoxal phosphate-containing UPF0001 family protein
MHRGLLPNRQVVGRRRQRVQARLVELLKLAQRLDRFASTSGRRLPILLEMNVSGEASKYGFTPAESRGMTEIGLPSTVQG